MRHMRRSTTSFLYCIDSLDMYGMGFLPVESYPRLGLGLGWGRLQPQRIAVSESQQLTARPPPTCSWLLKEVSLSVSLL